MTRLPESLRRRLERAAAQNKRSMNTEIIHRLEQSLQQVDQQELAVQAATTALERAGFPVVPFGAPARDQSQVGQAKSADAEERSVRGLRRDEAKTEPPTPADTGEKDKP
jgi:hypothetical protein